MSLISEYVEVRISGKTRKRYESLGYKLPTHLDDRGRVKLSTDKTINIKVSDLDKWSNVKVKVQCDYCKKTYEKKYGSYLKNKHDNGKTYCQDCHNKVYFKGELSPNWNSTLTNKDRDNRRNSKSPKYKEFINKVFQRDGHKCFCCGNSDSGNLVVHHLNGFNWYTEGRYDDTNGITLCNTCHKNFHLKYGNGDNTKEQFEEWMGNTHIEFEKYDGVLPTRRAIYCYEDDMIFDNMDKCAECLGVTPGVIYSCCNTNSINNIDEGKYGTHTIKNKHLFWYDEYKYMTEEEINSFIDYAKKNYKKIVCLNTLEIFETIRDASKKTCVSETSISSCCRGNYTTTSNKDGDIYVWSYYDDYLKMSNKEIKLKTDTCYKYICITDGKKFCNSQEVMNEYGFTQIQFQNIFKNKQGVITKENPNNYSFIKVMKYKDYIKLNTDELQKILDEVPRTKSIICLTDGKIYPSTLEASQEYNIDRSFISKILRNNVKQCKGYEFDYCYRYFNNDGFLKKGA